VPSPCQLCCASQGHRHIQRTRINGIGAPNNTPREIIESLNADINAALADPKLIARFPELGGNPMTLTPVEHGKLLIDENEKWAKVVKFTGAEPD
jgi:tripartite-type tricarboxylate transporter receptor subunit TctC